jgi:hypothetical protein
MHLEAYSISGELVRTGSALARYRGNISGAFTADSPSQRVCFHTVVIAYLSGTSKEYAAECEEASWRLAVNAAHLQPLASREYPCSSSPDRARPAG